MNKQESLLPSVESIIEKIEYHGSFNFRPAEKKALEIQIKEAMEMVRDRTLECAAEKTKLADIGSFDSEGVWRSHIVINTNSVLSLKEDDKLKVH